MLSRRVKKTNRGDVAKHGAVPEIELLNGARLKFKTRTSGGGRGLSGRKVILDEGYALQAGQLGALLPIMLAQPDPQVYVGSSACRPESAVLWDMVKRGRAGGDPRMVYAEWCAPDPSEACADGERCHHDRGTVGCGCDKPELLKLAHTAVTRGRILIESLVDARKLPVEEYCREIMGWHDSTQAGEQPISLDSWAALEDVSPMLSVRAFAVEVSLDRAWASVGAAGPTSDGRIAVELVDRRRGTGWVVDRCKELARHGVAQFVVDGGGPASSLIPDMQSAGLSVLVINARDVAAACAGIVDAAAQRTICHGPQADLEEAVLGAAKRPLGDGAFAFGRKISTVDIDAFLAVTLAYWAARENRPPEVHSIRELMAQIEAERAEAGGAELPTVATGHVDPIPVEHHGAVPVVTFHSF